MLCFSKETAGIMRVQFMNYTILKEAVLSAGRIVLPHYLPLRPFYITVALPARAERTFLKNVLK